MSMFDSIFDCNHDGQTDALETTLGFLMMDEMECADARAELLSDAGCEPDDFGFDDF